MNNTIASFSNVLRKMYRPEAVNAKIYENNKTFERIKKVGDFEGTTIENAVAVSYGQGVGSTIAFAIANKTGDAFQRFSVPRKLVYGIGTIDGELIRAAKTGKGSQVAPALQRVRDNNLKVVRRYINHSLWSNGGGAFGRIATGGISTNTITLSEPNDVVWFEAGMILQLSSDDGSPLAPAGVRAGTITITSVNRDTGVITASGNITAGIAAAAAGDYIFRNGSYAAVFDGIPKWVPRTSAEAAQALYGVTRSTDVTRLAGLRQETAQGATIVEALMLALARAAREGIEPDYCPMHPEDMQALVMSQQDKVMYQGGSPGKLQIGFKGGGLTVMSPAGHEVEVVADAGVRKGDGWLLTLKTWEYHYAGSQFPELLDDDGVVMLREPTADQYTWRVGGYGNLMCTSPQDNMYFAMPQG